MHGKVVNERKSQLSYSEYEEGLAHGKRIIYGIGCEKLEMQNDFRHGRYQAHYENGTYVKAETKYGKYHGLYQVYDSEGTLEEEKWYVNGKEENQSRKIE